MAGITPSHTFDLLVIGGGAAGFFTAIQCGENAQGAKIGILEATNKTLTKVKISGGGRCNVTNQLFNPPVFVTNYPRGQRELLGPMHRFGALDTVRWFDERGVRLVAESDGRMFPSTNTSQTIVDCLQDRRLDLNIELITQASVKSATYQDGLFLITSKQGHTYTSRYLAVATGSSPTGYDLAGQLGHTVVSPVPSLFTLTIDDPILKERMGVSVGPPLKPTIKLAIKTKESDENPAYFVQSGPILITHWGLSGPAVLRLSAFAARELHASGYQATATINWLNPISQLDVQKSFEGARKSHGKKKLQNFNPFPIAGRLWEYALEKAQVSVEQTFSDCSMSDLTLVAKSLTQDTLKVSGKGIFKEEFVTAGGVNLSELNFRTMESKHTPGLYWIGEVLDIDGVTGGFNFQNAWTGGALAGRDIAQKLKP